MIKSEGRYTGSQEQGQRHEGTRAMALTSKESGLPIASPGRRKVLGSIYCNLTLRARWSDKKSCGLHVVCSASATACQREEALVEEKRRRSGPHKVTEQRYPSRYRLQRLGPFSHVTTNRDQACADASVWSDSTWGLRSPLRPNLRPTTCRWRLFSRVDGSTRVSWRTRRSQGM
ncbi:hypothetical protein BDZ85DRAFT_100692 [Elsinoe ampelina]|uniref:Uncharacterized protein n=1 Tax=Elsinoe ampelina TaxID=302913 RepID=A0A6A6GF18_9PEZI|nr:hypothetical protein BDZ85DRAFT_100692 [Elsinoe ampelina]